MTERQNLFVSKNTDYKKPFVISDTNGPIDMSGHSFYGQIRKDFSTAVVADFDFTVVNLTVGSIEFFLTSAVTENLKPGKYNYDILSKNDSTGVVTKHLEGLLYLTETVTRVE